MTDLQKQYFDLTGAHPDRRWKEATLQSKVDELLEKRAEQQRKQAERDAERERDRAERAQRVKDRGELSAFAARAFREELAEDERLLSWIALRLLREAEAAQDTIDSFIEKMQNDPSYALGWSLSSFEAAGRLAVFREFQRGFEAGMTLQMWQEEVMRQVLRRASRTPRSTSPTSNLAEQMETEAWARAADLCREEY